MLLIEVKKSTELIFEYRTKIILIRFLLICFLSIWIIGFLLPTITLSNNSIFNFLLSRVYSTVCHQESVKCISFNSASMLVCSRCAGIYSGAFTAGLLNLLLIVPSISRKVLILSAIPLAIDVFLTFTGVYNYSQGLAFATGLAFGGIIYLLIMSELESLFFKKTFSGE